LIGRAAVLPASGEPEQVRAVDALRRGDDSRWRDCAEMSSEWFWEQNDEFRYTWVSEGARRLGAEFHPIGLAAWELAADRGSAAQWAAHKARLARHEPFRDFRFALPADGAVRHISLSGKPIFDEGGGFRGYRGAGRDVTVEIEAAETVRRAREDANAARAEGELLRRLADDTNRYLLEAQRIGKLGHWFTDEATKTVTWSPQMFEITGQPPQPVMHFDLTRVPPLHPDDAPHFVAVREHAIATGDPAGVEARFVRPDGGIRWVHIEMQAHYDAAGEVVSVFGTTQDVTDRKRVEDELKAARTQLIDAIESISEGFALFDSDDRYVLTNSRYRELYPKMVDVFASGCTYEEMIRTGIARGMWAVDGDRDAFARRLLAWHRNCDSPMERQLSDGRWIRAAEQRTPSGGIVAIRTDITEQKTAEAALKAAREQLIDAIESVSEGFALFDRDDRYVMTNTNYLHFYPGRADLFVEGTRYEDMLRGSIARGRDLAGEEPEAWVRRMVEWHQACRQPMERQGPDGRWIRQVERRTSDGGIVAIRTDITAVKEAEAALVQKVCDLEAAQDRLERLTGNLAAMADDLAAARDAAQEKAAALERSETRFRDFALTSSHWLWETDAQHRFAFVSDGVRSFGFTPEMLLGRSRLDIAADAADDPLKWEEHHAALARREPFRDFIFTWENGAGREGVAVVSGDPVFDTDSGFLGYRGTGRDITEQVEAENALREAMRAAQAASLAKSQFLANMSHELRTPLNAIIGFSEMIQLALRGPLPEGYREYSRLIQQSGEHLHAVINDILDLAKVDAGKFELRKETGVDPRQIAEACLTLVRGHAEVAKIKLSAAIEDGLPSLVADPTRLKQVLLNLLSNAIKFTGADGSVALAVRRDGEGRVVFEVRDTGRGMTAAEVEVALEPFGQISEGMVSQEGTGLGLPLARRLAELHGGSLRVESRKGSGTTVTVMLPAPKRAVSGAPGQ